MATDSFYQRPAHHDLEDAYEPRFYQEDRYEGGLHHGHSRQRGPSDAFAHRRPHGHGHGHGHHHDAPEDHCDGHCLHPSRFAHPATFSSPPYGEDFAYSSHGPHPFTFEEGEDRREAHRRERQSRREARRQVRDERVARGHSQHRSRNGGYQDLADVVIALAQPVQQVLMTVLGGQQLGPGQQDMPSTRAERSQQQSTGYTDQRCRRRERHPDLFAGFQHPERPSFAPCEGRREPQHSQEHQRPCEFFAGFQNPERSSSPCRGRRQEAQQCFPTRDPQQVSRGHTSQPTGVTCGLEGRNPVERQSESRQRSPNGQLPTQVQDILGAVLGSLQGRNPVEREPSRPSAVRHEDKPASASDSGKGLRGRNPVEREQKQPRQPSELQGERPTAGPFPAQVEDLIAGLVSGLQNASVKIEGQGKNVPEQLQTALQGPVQDFLASIFGREQPVKEKEEVKVSSSAPKCEPQQSAASSAEDKKKSKTGRVYFQGPCRQASTSANPGPSSNPEIKSSDVVSGSSQGSPLPAVAADSSSDASDRAARTPDLPSLQNPEQFVANIGDAITKGLRTFSENFAAVASQPTVRVGSPPPADPRLKTLNDIRQELSSYPALPSAPTAHDLVALEEHLTRLLIRADGVQSDGCANVREERKRVVAEVTRRLEDLDHVKREFKGKGKVAEPYVVGKEFGDLTEKEIREDALVRQEIERVAAEKAAQTKAEEVAAQANDDIYGTEDSKFNEQKEALVDDETTTTATQDRTDETSSAAVSVSPMILSESAAGLPSPVAASIPDGIDNDENPMVASADVSEEEDEREIARRVDAELQILQRRSPADELAEFQKKAATEGAVTFGPQGGNLGWGKAEASSPSPIQSNEKLEGNWKKSSKAEKKKGKKGKINAAPDKHAVSYAAAAATSATAQPDSDDSASQGLQRSPTDEFVVVSDEEEDMHSHGIKAPALD
ncbi:hypothetical protein HKX48_007020 [Thoreauomyces humboldtii]|nr:hypothetical protein HKX48_007020 [Thoreauomyces humboldtii]